MKNIIVLVVILLFYNCAPKTITELKPLIDTSSVLANTNTYDGGFSEFGTQSRRIAYDSISSMHCQHKNLSRDFNIDVFIEKKIDTTEGHVSSDVKILLFDKIRNILFDSIQLHSEFYYGTIFDDCKNVRSYTTGFNKEKEAMDNHYGDIVVADFNFDDREDIALINDMGGNAGPLYSFFIQDADRMFKKDIFLTDSMEFFPAKIDKVKKKLTIYVHAGVCGLGEHIYAYESNTGLWKEESHKIINICK